MTVLAGVTEVEHGHEHLHRVVAGVEDLAVLHRHEALVSAHHEDGLCAGVRDVVRLLRVLGLSQTAGVELERIRCEAGRATCSVREASPWMWCP